MIGMGRAVLWLLLLLLSMGFNRVGELERLELERRYHMVVDGGWFWMWFGDIDIKLRIPCPMCFYSLL